MTSGPLNSALNEKAAPIGVLGGTAVKFSTLKNSDLSKDWTDGTTLGRLLQRNSER
jgi:hypothetical protein